MSDERFFFLFTVFQGGAGVRFFQKGTPANFPYYFALILFPKTKMAAQKVRAV